MKANIFKINFFKDLLSEECLDNQGKRCFGCLARGGGCDNLSREKCSRAFRFGAKWCPGKLILSNNISSNFSIYKRNSSYKYSVSNLLNIVS